MLSNITFLSFLLFSMCHSTHVAVNTWLNCSFFTLISYLANVKLSIRTPMMMMMTTMRYGLSGLSTY